MDGQTTGPNPSGGVFLTAGKMKKYIILFIAALTGGTALYVLIPEHLRYWAHVVGDIARGQNPFADTPVGLLALMIGFDAILLGKLIAATGLIFLAKWAWPLSMVVLSGDVIMRIIGIINILTTSEDEYLPAFDAEAVVFTVSTYPTYIITAISVASLIALASRPIRQSFVDKSMSTHNASPRS